MWIILDLIYLVLVYFPLHICQVIVIDCNGYFMVSKDVDGSQVVLFLTELLVK